MSLSDGVPLSGAITEASSLACHNSAVLFGRAGVGGKMERDARVM